ncbi:MULTISPECIES: hypothetical protein [unclassified Arthrobacter]|uniref:hypothetical protein n=1 Tax=unclassified Arthrobacter TaxID=235627 RepID=UPI002882E1EC|nr:MULTISPECIES: hypothetical protein [unclassified Arthrobacter]
METTETITINVNSPEDRDIRLGAAELELIGLAMRAGTQGILMTQHGHGRYSASLSGVVPFGITLLAVH